MESTGAHSSDESNYAPVQERPFDYLSMYPLREETGTMYRRPSVIHNDWYWGLISMKKKHRFQKLMEIKIVFQKLNSWVFFLKLFNLWYIWQILFIHILNRRDQHIIYFHTYFSK